MTRPQGPKSLGKSELVSWAAEASGVYPCHRYEDFKDGLIFLALFDSLFPGVVDSNTVRLQRSGPRHPKQNWDDLKNGGMSVGLPISVLDRRGVSAGQQRPVYNALVMFFFLTKLTMSSDFTVDFAHPIDDSLAEFLQSPASLDCLAKAQRARAANMGGDGGGHGSASVPRPRSSSPQHAMSPPGQMGMAPPAASPSGRLADDVKHASVDRDHHRGSSTSQPATAPQPQANGGPARGSLHRQWASDAFSEAGEVTILRLTKDVERLERKAAYAQQEQQHIRQYYEARLEQQALAHRDDLAAVERNADQRMSQVELENEGSRRALRHDLHEALQRALDEAAIASDTAAFDMSTSVDALRTENTSLKQQKSFFESQNFQLRAEIQEQRLLLQGLQRDVNDSRVVQDKMQKTYMDVVERCRGERIPDDALVPGAAPHEQAAVINYIRLLREELDGARTTAARCEEELRTLQERNDFGHGGASSAGADNVTQAVANAKTETLLQKANATVSYLRQTIKRMASGDQTLRDFNHDYASEELTAGITLPSTMFKAVSAEELAAVVQSVVAKLEGNVNQDLYDQVSSATWRLGSAFSALQSRLDTAGSSMRTLYNRLAEAERNTAVLRHEADSQIGELRLQAQRASEDALRSVNRELSDLKLQVELARSDAERAHSDARNMHDRMQANLNAALKDAERQMQDLRDRLGSAERTATSSKSREDVMRQLSDLRRRDVDRMSTADRQMHELKERTLQQQLHQMDSAAGGSRVSSGNGGTGGGDDTAAMVQRATMNMRERLEACVEELRDEQAKHQEAVVALQGARMELEKAKHAAAADRDERHTAETQLAHTRRDGDRCAEELATLKARTQTEMEAFQRQYRELEEYAQRIGHAIADGVPIGGLAKPAAAAPAFASASSLHSQPVEQQRPLGMLRSGSADSESRHRSGTATPQPQGQTGSLYGSSQQRAGPSSTPGGASTRTPGNLYMPAPSSPITASSARPAASAPSTAGGGGGSSSVLTQDELERRKMEILAKYGVKPSS